eukprot:TRINITY_DN515_c0_g2_i1.p1 TRINITY_DN515_c0_g2~~TRINITY_DN515_c0_g2_i1.p1  ORF type:complete len:305 (+),score=46.69 TRINITY_DN515_c0_g2_i1:66-980(+)
MISLKVVIANLENEDKQIRRIRIDGKQWTEVKQLVTDWCGGYLKHVTYIDDEQDQVLITTQAEWEECIRIMNNVVKVTATKETCMSSHKKQLLARKPTAIEDLLSLARCESLLGCPEKSVMYLKKALVKGATVRRTELVEDPDFESVVQSKHYCKLFTPAGAKGAKKSKKQKKEQKHPNRRVAVEKNPESELSTNLIHVQPQRQPAVEVSLTEVVAFSPVDQPSSEEGDVTPINTRSVKVSPSEPCSYTCESESLVIKAHEYSSELASVKELVGETTFPESQILDLLRKNAGDIFRVCFQLLGF